MVSYFLLKLNIPAGPEYENTTLYQCKGKVFPDTKTAGVKSKFSEKRSYQNSENIHYFLTTRPGFTKFVRVNEKFAHSPKPIYPQYLILRDIRKREF